MPDTATTTFTPDQIKSAVLGNGGPGNDAVMNPVLKSLEKNFNTYMPGENWAMNQNNFRTNYGHYLNGVSNPFTQNATNKALFDATSAQLQGQTPTIDQSLVTPHQGQPVVQGGYDPSQLQQAGQQGGLPSDYQINTPQNLAAAQVAGAPPQDSGAARGAIQSYAPSSPVFYKPPTPVPGYDPQTVFDASGKALSSEQYLAAGGKPDYSNVQAGSPPQQAGMGGSLGGPGGVGSGGTGVNTLTESPLVNSQLAISPGYQQLLADYANYNSIATQGQSMSQTYQNLTTQLGIPAMNTQLLNWKNIIDGSEQDVRTEVTKAGGFATDSQVLALTSSRNKQLVQNYNNLLQTKTQAMETLKTMTDLAAQDRTFALNAIDKKLQLDQQMMDYQQKMQTNAQVSYQKIIDTVGYKGLAQMTNNDPYYRSLVERSLGLHPGGLAQLASIGTAEDQSKYPEVTKEWVNVLASQGISTTGKSITQLGTEAKQKGLQGLNDYMTMDANRKATKVSNTTINQAASHEQTQIDDFHKSAASYVADMDTQKMTWGAAWSALHAQFPQASTELIDSTLQASKYRNKDHGG